MVVYELLSQGRIFARQQVETRSSGQDCAVRTSAPATAAMPPPRKISNSPKSTKVGSVKGFVRDRLFPADGTERAEMKSLIHGYRTWCAEKGFTPKDLKGFLDEIERLCVKLGIKIEVGDDQRVYCCGVKIEVSSTANVR